VEESAASRSRHQSTQVVPTLSEVHDIVWRWGVQTYHGIDTCGDRLAAEIQALVNESPSLEYISMMGHSMGGLLVRYAAGKLLEPETGRVAGLKPMHFITIATPHLGCHAMGESQVQSSPLNVTWLDVVFLPACVKGTCRL
jgi:triacylglycerol esterase/lipase EstA (alpha/beta hydrolase family)